MSSRVFGSKVTQEEERGLANARPLSPIFEVPPLILDKGFVIGGYFGTGTFECCGAMLMGQ